MKIIDDIKSKITKEVIISKKNEVVTYVKENKDDIIEIGAYVIITGLTCAATKAIVRIGMNSAYAKGYSKGVHDTLAMQKTPYINFVEK